MVCAACCVLPFALPAVVLASAGGVLAVFAQAFWGALYLAAVMVGGAWFWGSRTRAGRKASESFYAGHEGRRHRGTQRCIRVVHIWRGWHKGA